jgi:hypothetical protein
MTVRVTQQVIQAAFETDPEARVTTFVLEALHQDNTTPVRVTSVVAEVLYSTSGAGGGGGPQPIMYVIAG